MRCLLKGDSYDLHYCIFLYWIGSWLGLWSEWFILGIILHRKWLFGLGNQSINAILVVVLPWLWTALAVVLLPSAVQAGVTHCDQPRGSRLIPPLHTIPLHSSPSSPPPSPPSPPSLSSPSSPSSPSPPAESCWSESVSYHGQWSSWPACWSPSCSSQNNEPSQLCL